MALKPAIHGRDHAPRGADPMPVVLFIKVFSDTQVVTTTPAFNDFLISKDMDGIELTFVETYVSTVSSSGKPTVQLTHVGGNAMLSTACEIDASEKNSKDAATQMVINAAEAGVVWGEHILITVTVAGTGAKGLGLYLTFQAS